LVEAPLQTIAALIAAALLAAAVALPGAAPQKKSPAPAARKTAANKAAPKKGAATAKKSSTASKKKTTSRKAAPATTWRNRQIAPEPQRYRDIQEALIEKGYLQGAPTGRWDQASIDALRRFQQEQNLQPSGKINSLSLIALGLGPKYDAAAMPPAAPAAP
jgi:hypothetical protein